MTETEKGFIQLHTSVLLAGFTGLFGRLITLNEVDIVWYQSVFPHWDGELRQGAVLYVLCVS